MVGEARYGGWRTAVIAASLLFALVAACVATGISDGFDVTVMLALRRTAPSQGIVEIVTSISQLGASIVRIPLAVAVIALLCAMKRYPAAIFMAAAISGGLVLTGLLKPIFARPRPELLPHLEEVASTGFPSGHALGATVTYGALAVIIGSIDARYRQSAAICAIALIALIGLTRVYLGVHMPTDVIAGWSVGLAWLALCSRLAPPQ